MKVFALVLAAASGLTLLPLLLLTRATRQVVPGKGPQGGEALLLLWILVLAWTWVASSAAFVSAGLVLGTTPLVRHFLWPAASLAGVTAWTVALFALLARGFDPPAGSARLGPGVTVAGALAALLLVASQAVHLRAVLRRG